MNIQIPVFKCSHIYFRIFFFFLHSFIFLVYLIHMNIVCRQLFVAKRARTQVIQHFLHTTYAFVAAA